MREADGVPAVPGVVRRHPGLAVPYREFGTATREPSRDPIEFGFAGKRFRCIDDLPFPLLEEILRKVPVDEQGRVDAARANLYGILIQVGPFFRQIIVDHDVVGPDGGVVAYGLEEFEQVLRSKANPGDVRTLMEIMTWLVEEYVGRPTEQPSASLPGAATTGVRSRVVSLSRGTVTEVDTPGEAGAAEGS